MSKKKEIPKKLTFYYTDWCHYCTEFKPIWHLLRNKLSIPAFEVNCSYMENPPVHSFPTIMLDINGRQIEYVGDRTIEGITDFINIH
jgi:hypothetical protein